MMLACLIAATCLAAPEAAPPEAASTIELDARKQLFLDDYAIASSENVTRAIHPAQKHPLNPVLRPEEAWEGTSAILYGSVIREGDRWRMWYHSDPGVSYAESKDGLTWTKPKLGLFTIDGHDTNVVVRRGDEQGTESTFPFFYEAFGVTRDDRDPDPARRYKMGFLSIQRDYDGPSRDPFHGNQRRGLGVAGSPDGIHWKLIDNWTTDAICDGATYWMFDPAAEHYVLYGRTKFAPEEVTQAWANDAYVKENFWGRAVARVESPDFLDWNLKAPASAPIAIAMDTQDPPGTEIYGMVAFTYGNAYVGLAQRYVNQQDNVFLDIQLAVSHDSLTFDRVGDRAPFIPCGGVGEWDRFNNSLANNPPIEVGDELWIYYGGRTSRHSPYKGPDDGDPKLGAIGVATIQRDRFVSLSASFDGGRITTKPMTIKGATLHLNAKCDFGTITVEALGADGQSLARSKPIRQDALDIAVEWEGGTLPASDQPITLRFELRNALLYAIWAA